MSPLNKQVLERLYIGTDEDALLLLVAITASLKPDESDLGKQGLSHGATILEKVREQIKNIGIENIKALDKEITKILRANFSKGAKKSNFEMERVAIRTVEEANPAAKEKVNAIEKDEWLNPLEIEALMRVEDKGYPTPNLNGMKEKTKWQYFHLASAKVRILSALNVKI